ncbi:MAG TPA: helix-turn-helix domain-containing protein [Firmicutes bacterium]|nr:helix-turn-helix domain-containing protein [Bacillota bacterium]
MNLEILKHLRHERKLTQSQLGAQLGVSTSTIGMYEQGRREPDNRMVLRMSKVFGVTADYLLQEESIKDGHDITLLTACWEKELRQSRLLILDGKPLTDEQREVILSAIQEGINRAKSM